MKRSLALIVVAAILSFPLVVEAHGSATHVLGTVTTVSYTHLTLPTKA